MRMLLSLVILLGSTELLAVSCPRFLQDLFPLSKPSQKITERLIKEFPQNITYIPKAKAQALQKELNLSENQFMIELLPIAKRLASPVISEYQVGAIAKTPSGSFLLGTNIEFANGDPNGTIHGEHFLIASAFISGVHSLEKIALSAAPCGLCRQMINETADSDKIQMLFPESYPKKFSKVLPESFGPKDLGQKSALLNSKHRSFKINASIARDRLVGLAVHALENSYSPYIRMASGIALELKDGSSVTGSHFENAAFQKVSALNVAIVSMYTRGILDFSQIKRAVLVHEKSERAQGSEIEDTKAILSKIAPGVELEIYPAYSPFELPFEQ